MVNLRGSSKTRIVVDEETEQGRCEKHPAGHPVTTKTGDACLFIYSEEGKPINGVEIENITPDSVELKDSDTGETKKVDL